MDLLAKFKVILLDMNSTFMFGEDKFSPDTNYWDTYRNLGGFTLTDNTVNSAVQACYDLMSAYYENPQYYDNFPQIIDTLRTLPQTQSMSEDDILKLDKVIALHELGTVPPEYATFLKKLSITHELGLIANIWAKKQPWLAELERVEVKHLFKKMVFSSDYSSIKPSPKLFAEALKVFTVNKSEIVFIGDSIKYDIQGAKAVGLATIWIRGEQEDSNEADMLIDDLLDLSA